jgi:hypothetical protein
VLRTPRVSRQCLSATGKHDGVAGGVHALTGRGDWAMNGRGRAELGRVTQSWWQMAHRLRDRPEQERFSEWSVGMEVRTKMGGSHHFLRSSCVLCGHLRCSVGETCQRCPCASCFMQRDRVMAAGESRWWVERWPGNAAAMRCGDDSWCCLLFCSRPATWSIQRFGW